MLRSIKLTCFRKHVEKTITFEKGLNVMKAPNEGGKSTVIESCLYALYGATALRNSLADTVTWGRKETELKVELLIEVNGRLFKFTRSKGGAECEYDGGIVTGQKEVSNFAAEIIGADANTANRLMLANQGNLRGALEDGPKAVATQIESLSDFDLFDRLLESASNNLMTGPTGVLEERLRQKDEAVAEMDVAPPNTLALDTQIAEANALIVTSSARIKELEPLKAEAQGRYDSAQNQKRMREMLETNLRKAQEQKALHVEQKKAADEKRKTKYEDIPGLKLAIESALIYDEKIKVHSSMITLMSKYPDVFWEGSKESFEAEITRQEKELASEVEEINLCKGLISRLEAEVAGLEASRILSTTCPTCKQELTNKDEILAKNQELEVKVAEKKVKLKEHTDDLAACVLTKKNLEAELQTLKGLRSTATPFETFAAKNLQHLEVDEQCYPPRLSWKGCVPGENVNVEDLKNRVSQAESAKEAAERADARFHALTETLKEDEESINRLESQLAQTPEVDVEAAHEEARKYGNEIAVLKIDMENAEASIKGLEKQKTELEMQYQLRVQAKEAATKERDRLVADLEAMQFNNGLVKKIRSARPLIADKLWNTVLCSVTTMFSQMRGEQSVITKGKEGFTVNGETVSSLSGSTLDLLGLAIRVALVKTFLPNTDFIVLDEPFAACDDQRTSAMLGFLATCGFNQIIVVSHEDCAEAAADTVISL